MSIQNAIFYVDYGGEDLVPQSYADNGSGLVRVTTWLNSPPTDSLVTITGTPSVVYTPTAYADNGSGLVRVTIASHSLVTGDTIVIAGTTGSVYSGRYKITYVSATQVDLQGSVFSSNPASKGSATAPYIEYTTGRPWKITKISAYVFDLQGSSFVGNPSPKGACTMGGSDTDRDSLLSCVFAWNAGTGKMRATKVAHGLVTGSAVYSNHTGGQGYYKVTVIDADNFDLDGSANVSGSTQSVNPFGGDSWGNAWKTIGGTPQSVNGKGVSPVIRLAKSPDPTLIGDCTWTNKSATVTIPAGIVTSVYNSGNWTAAVGAGAVINGGSANSKLASAVQITCPTTPVTNTLIAYLTVGGGSGLDLSAYQQLSFWVRPGSGTYAVNTFKLCLCSDTLGATPVATFNLPTANVTNTFYPITIDNGVPLSSSIKSIALYAGSVTTSPNFNIIFSNIIACKNPNDPTAITLNSLISTHNGTGTDPFLSIQSINDTNLVLDISPQSNASATNRGWSGTTGVYASYKREPIRTILVNGGSYCFLPKDTGSAGNYVTYSGGWDKVTNTQTSIASQTYFDGRTALTFGLDISNTAYIAVERMSFLRYYYGIGSWSGSSLTGIHTNNNISVVDMNNNATAFYSGVQFNWGTLNIANVCNHPGLGSFSSSGNITIGNMNSNQSTFYSPPASIVTITNCNNCSTTAVSPGVGSKNYISNCKDNAGGGIYGSTNATTLNCTLSGNSVGDIVNITNNQFKLVNCLVNDTLEVAAMAQTNLTQFNNLRITSKDHDKTPGYNKIFTDGGLIETNTSIVHTAGGKSWKLSPSSTHRSSLYPLDLLVTTVAVLSTSTVTVTAWVYRDNAGITAKLACPNNQVSGGPLVTQVSADATLVGSWEKLTLTWTPDTPGVAEVYFWAYGGTTYAAYIDDIEVL